MQHLLPPLISAEALLALPDLAQTVLLDARGGPDAAAAYAASHLAGALRADLETDLADTSGDPAQGGRHPLPAPAAFAQLLERLGISPETHVVICDAQSGANAAARAWWMLRAFGHQHVQVLDGGIQAAAAAGFPLRSGAEPEPAPGRYPARDWSLPLTGIREVEQMSQDPACVVIDVRDAARYEGRTEPIDPVAGHIPGAANLPFSRNLSPDGRFLSPEALRTLYGPLLGGRSPEQAAVHCGSGVTACHTLLALAHAGYELPALFVGSWSEWCRSGRPIAVSPD
ncbi:MAG: sulfurtransferase [Bacteroidia bacterium]|nr:sulfurtransferase [Bacteroidia bacterium]